MKNKNGQAVNCNHDRTFSVSGDATRERKLSEKQNMEEIARTEEFVVVSTGKDWDFAKYVENLTNHPIAFVLNENETNRRKNVYEQTDDVENAEANYGFVVRPHEWIGLFNSDYVIA